VPHLGVTIIASTAGSPKGVLTGKYTPDASARHAPPHVCRDRLIKAQRRSIREDRTGAWGQDAAQISLNWLVAKEAMHPGAKNLRQARKLRGAGMGADG
jgi:aryl-alcohol dehydrogenase-like predicted oxidoreductase